MTSRLVRMAAVTSLALYSLSGCAAVQQQVGLAVMPVATEIELGQQLATQVEEQQRVLDDRQIQEYVAGIAVPLIEASQRDRTGIDYRIRVLDDPNQINAFALPGGPIFVYTGLLLLAENECEVAGVLAHEIGHVVGRHSANRLATQLGISLAASIALGEQPDELAKLAADLAGAGTMAAFSRDDERESDKYGVAYTVAAGYDPRGLATFFAKLHELEGGGQKGVFEGLMASHPATAERIADLRKRIARAGELGGRIEAERYRQMRSRLAMRYR